MQPVIDPAFWKNVFPTIIRIPIPPLVADTPWQLRHRTDGTPLHARSGQVFP